MYNILLRFPVLPDEHVACLKYSVVHGCIKVLLALIWDDLHNLIMSLLLVINVILLLNPAYKTFSYATHHHVFSKSQPKSQL